MEAEECGYREIKRVLICPVWVTIKKMEFSAEVEELYENQRKGYRP